MPAVVVFENEIYEPEVIISDMAKDLESLISLFPTSQDVVDKVVNFLKSEDDAGLKKFSASNKIEAHHISHLGAKFNLPYAVDYLKNNKLGDIWTEQYEYIVPYALILSSNDFVARYVASKPSKYELNKQIFIFEPWHYFAAISGNIDGLKLLSELDYNPPVDDENNKHGWKDAALVGAITTDNLEAFKFLVEEGLSDGPISIHENWGIVSQAIVLVPALKITSYLLEKHKYAETKYAIMSIFKCVEQLQVVQTVEGKKDAISAQLAMLIEANVDMTEFFGHCHEEAITNYVANKILEFCVTAINDNIPSEKRGQLANEIIANWSLSKMNQSS